MPQFGFRTADTPAETLRGWSAGDTEVAGMVDEVRRQGLQLVPILYASATPSGPVQAETFEELCRLLIAGLSADGPFDGVLLALHGAMYSHEFPHADAEIVRRVRTTVGPKTPLVMCPSGTCSS